MRIDIVTGFPRMLDSALNESILKIGQREQAVRIHVHDLRNFTGDKHRTIDDYPYGGGPGMVLKIEPIVRCLDALAEDCDLNNAHFVLPTPRGLQYDQKTAVKLSLIDHLVFLCGHYKGIDERIHEFYPVREISIGDYVLSSGEIAALVMIDSIVRLLPGVISDINSALTDSFSDELLDTPYYTRPEVFRGKRVPDVLLSGHHKDIDTWKKEKSEQITRERRPDLFEKYLKSK